MSDEFKIAPLEPSREMLSMGSVSCLGKLDHESIAQLWQAMLAAAPVPPAGGVQFVGYPPVPEDRKLSPAGDVEVLGCAIKDYPYSLRHSRSELDKLTIPFADDQIVELVDRAHVTRLTAERDGLLAERQDWQKLQKRTEDQFFEVLANRDALQSELTKARELLNEVKAKGYFFSGEFMLRLEDALAHQSAPAAKGEPRCNEERAELGLTTPPDCAACGRGSCFDR